MGIEHEMRVSLFKNVASELYQSPDLKSRQRFRLSSRSCCGCLQALN